MLTWPQLQTAFTLVVLGPSKMNLSSWFIFFYQDCLFFQTSILHLTYLTVTKSTFPSFLFMFWFHPLNIVIKIFSPDCWIYTLVIKPIPITEEMHKKHCVNKGYYWSVSSPKITFIITSFKWTKNNYAMFFKRKRALFTKSVTFTPS